MKREQIARGDFPPAADGYDRASVDAHLAAVAAWTAALEAQVSALEVERDALRAHADRAAPAGVESDPVSSPGPEPESVTAEPDPEPADPVAAGSADEGPVEADPMPPGGDDEVSARLVATRLALEGAEREQILEKLGASYELDDVDSLVDDVLERLG